MTADLVTAVVVTYNRREMLLKCLDRIESQTRRVQSVLVIDNASSDGTAEAIRTGWPDVELVVMPENLGGAAGFYEGIRLAHAAGAGWTWVLDDDTLVEPTALEALLEGARRARRPPALLTSAVLWRDGTLHPMNRPWPRWTDMSAMVDAAGRGLVPVRASTFVSTLIHRDAVERHGLPLRQYFLWVDDIEYTARILRESPGYLVPESRVFHWTPMPHDSLKDPGDRFYYHVRNTLWLLRGTSFGPIERLRYLLAYLQSIRYYLLQHPVRRHATRVVWRAVRDGLGRRPA